MNRAFRIVVSAALAVLILGVVCFGLSLILGADLVRIADTVFSRYDLTQTYLNVQALIAQASSFFGMF